MKELLNDLFYKEVDADPHKPTEHIYNIKCNDLNQAYKIECVYDDFVLLKRRHTTKWYFLTVSFKDIISVNWNEECGEMDFVVPPNSDDIPF